MKTGNIFNILYIGILFIILNPSTLCGQPYSGGENSGAFAVNTVLVNCTALRFTGADNSGSALSASALLNCVTDRFVGDTAAGSASLASTFINCDPTNFQGGDEAGSDDALTTIMNCTNERFAGDSSSGSAVMMSSLLNCIPERFYGDSGNGHFAGSILVIRRFLGEDTSLVLVCNNDSFNLLNLYNAAGLSYNWNTNIPTAAAPGTYQLIATNQAGCVDTALAFLKQEIAKWTGATNNNWHDATNWNDGKIPGGKTHVIIPGGTLNACQVKDADATAASIQALSAGSFSIINNRVIIITGNCISLPPEQ